MATINIPGVAALQKSVQQLVDSIRKLNSTSQAGATTVSMQAQQVGQYQVPSGKFPAGQIKDDIAATQDYIKRQQMIARMAQQQLRIMKNATSGSFPINANATNRNAVVGAKSNILQAQSVLQDQQKALQSALLNTAPAIGQQQASRFAAAMVRAMKSGTPQSALSSMAVGAGIGVPAVAVSAVLASLGMLARTITGNIEWAQRNQSIVNSGAMGSPKEAARIRNVADIIGMDDKALADAINGLPMGMAGNAKQIISKIISPTTSDLEAHLLADRNGLSGLLSARTSKAIRDAVNKALYENNPNNTSDFSPETFTENARRAKRIKDLERGAEHVRNKFVDNFLDERRVMNPSILVDPLGIISGLFSGGPQGIKPMSGGKSSSKTPEDKLLEAADKFMEGADSIISWDGTRGGNDMTDSKTALPGAWGYYNITDGYTRNARSMGDFAL